MVRYTIIEYRAIIVCYGEAQWNPSEAWRIYREKYPTRFVPNVSTFGFEEDGCLKKKTKIQSGIQELIVPTVKNKRKYFAIFNINENLEISKVSSY